MEKIKHLKCNDCGLMFSINIETGRYTITKSNQLCCPSCQSTCEEIK